MRTVYDALVARDVEPLVALMHPNMQWRGRRTWRFWQKPPACHGPGEAGDVLRSQIEWRYRQGAHDAQLDRLEQRDGRVAVVLSWAEGSGRRQEWAHVLQLRDGVIVGIQDYASGTKAVRALDRRRPRR